MSFALFPIKDRKREGVYESVAASWEVKAITVAELTAKLSKLPQDHLVGMFDQEGNFRPFDEELKCAETRTRAARSCP